MNNLKMNLVFVITFGIIITILNSVGIAMALSLNINKEWGMAIVNLLIAVGLVIANKN